MPKLTLGPLDLIIVGVFLAALLALGFSAKLRDHSVLQFLAAGRNLSLPMFVATLVCSWYGGILGVGESVSYFGLGTFVLLGVPYYFFALIYALFFSTRVRSETPISIPERLEQLYGRGAGLTGAFLILLLALPAAHVLMLGVLAMLLSGWSLAVSVVFATLVGTLFLYKGGLLADVRSSLLAFIMMYIGFGVIVIQCVHLKPPLGAWKSIGRPELLSLDGGTGWPYVLSFLILGAWTLVDPGFHQRAASASTPAIGRRGVIVSAFCWFVFDILTISTGMYALSFMPVLPAAATKIEHLSVFPLFGQQILPPGLKAIFLCGMLGTITCAMVSYALVSGATIGREIICRIFPQNSDEIVRRWSQVGIALACALAVGIALTIRSVVDLWFQWGGAAIGALLLPVTFGYLTKGSRAVSSEIVVISMIMSAAVAFGWLWYGKSVGNDNLEVEFSGHRFMLGTLLPGLATSATICALGWIGHKMRRIYERSSTRRA